MISPPRSPLARLLGAIVAVLVLAGAFMLGLAALAVIFGLALVVALAAWVRGWWLARTGRASGTGAEDEGPTGSGSIEAEYTVISTRRETGDAADTERKL
ncbi:MAG: hypothetical protein P8008_00675 [Gammaproteobacteria bacterium]